MFYLEREKISQSVPISLIIRGTKGGPTEPIEQYRFFEEALGRADAMALVSGLIMAEVTGNAKGGRLIDLPQGWTVAVAGSLEKGSTGVLFKFVQGGKNLTFQTVIAEGATPAGKVVCQRISGVWQYLLEGSREWGSGWALVDAYLGGYLRMEKLEKESKNERIYLKQDTPLLILPR